jgi:DNA-binding NtrC family response regulator
MKAKKLLFVEDNLFAAEAIKSFLESRCSGVSMATSAEEAYEIFKKESPDIVITDIYLPGKSGIWLIKTIKQESPNTIVFAISADNSLNNAKEVKDAGATKFFPKPLDLDILEAAIEEALTNNS